MKITRAAALGLMAGAAAASLAALSAEPNAASGPKAAVEDEEAGHDHSRAPRRRPAKRSRPSASAEELQGRIDRALDSLFLQADRHWHAGEYESLASVQRTIVTLDPSDVGTWSDLGWILWAGLNREADAEKALREGLKANPRRYDMYYELGEYLYRRKRYGEAAEILTKAVAYKDADAITWNRYAHSLEKMGRPKQAAETWTKMAKLFPNNPHTPVNLARLKRHGLIP